MLYLRHILRCCAALFAFAGGAQSSFAADYSVVYSFQSLADGYQPTGLNSIAGTLYGVTTYGGSGSPQGGNGTIFKLSPLGSKSFVYQFPAGVNGIMGPPSQPVSGVLNVGKNLYGTTRIGGFYGTGALYKIDAAGNFSTFFSYGGEYSFPVGNLVFLKNSLIASTATVDPVPGNPSICTQSPSDPYGCGGDTGVGLKGSEDFSVGFQGIENNAYPESGPSDIGGQLYGAICESGTGAGSIYKTSQSGQVTIVYNFGSISNTLDGICPNSPLISVNGLLYGTTSYGGAYDAGTVFSLTPSGVETIIYSFKGGADGAQPTSGGLSFHNGKLYGASLGGSFVVCPGFGCGTIFSMTLNGSKTILHSFAGGVADGASPSGPLVLLGGALYGTTTYGGGTACAGDFGCGTVFGLKP